MLAQPERCASGKVGVTSAEKEGLGRVQGWEEWSWAGPQGVTAIIVGLSRAFPPRTTNGVFSWCSQMDRSISEYFYETDGVKGHRYRRSSSYMLVSRSKRGSGYARLAVCVDKSWGKLYSTRVKYKNQPSNIKTASRTVSKPVLLKQLNSRVLS